MNTHGNYPGYPEQLRVFRMPGSQLFLQRLEVTDKKLMQTLLQSLGLYGKRWDVMVRALASENLHGCKHVQQMCGRIMELRSPPSQMNASVTTSATSDLISPTRILRNMITNKKASASSSANGPELKNVARRKSKSARRADRKRAGKFNLIQNAGRRPRRTSKFMSPKVFQVSHSMSPVYMNRAQA